jgi:hypothetical protein
VVRQAGGVRMALDREGTLVQLFGVLWLPWGMPGELTRAPA